MPRCLRANVIVASLVLVAACGGGAAGLPTPLSSRPSSGVPIASASPAPPAPHAPSASPHPSPTPIALPSTADLAAAGEGVVWAFVADTRLFRSLDRGTTWVERTVPAVPRVAKISFVDDVDGWALATGSAATGCNGQYYEVWRTTDGATTWQRAFASDFASDAGCKSSLAFVDAQRGYISVSGRDVAPAILRSTDGGRSWSRSPRLPDPPGFRFEPSVTTLAPAAVADFGSVQLVSARSEASGNVRRHIYGSTDGGAAWSYRRAVTDPADIVFLTPTRWLQISTSSSSRETTDAGASWHAFTTDYSQAAPIAPQIVFGDARTGYVTVRGSIQRTLDGGAHWTSLKTPGT